MSFKIFFSPEYVGRKEDDEDPHKNSLHENVRYRDDLTEGYSVTPNFFIRGELPSFSDPKELNFKQFEDPYFRSNPNEHSQALIRDADDIKKEYLWEIRNRQFKNRLFDRDTLLLQVYNVNFLYVLKAYTSKHSAVKDEFKQTARAEFRKNFLKLLDDRYVFWALWPNGDEKDFVELHFKMLVGKFFKPLGLSCIILALERDTQKTDYDEVWNAIGKGCFCVLISPREIWEDNEKGKTVKLSIAQDKNSFENSKDGYYDSDQKGVFIKRDCFLERMKQPIQTIDSVDGETYKLTGNIFGDVDLSRIENRNQDLDDFFFLPCRTE